MDANRLWQTVLSDLEIEVGKTYFQTFLARTKLVSINETTATIGCHQPMYIELVEKKFHHLIKKTLDRYTQKNLNLIFTTLPTQPKKDFETPLFNIKRPSATSIIKLNPDYTFANFAVSSSNQMAHAAATAVAKTPGTTYNPLFIYGGTGVGKTHLMQAIGQEILKYKPQANIIYCTGEDFTNEIIEAISNKTTPLFRKKFRLVDILLIDDIQFIAGKNSIQEEFFHTFNAIQRTKGQIVLTSDKPPEEINKLEERLRSRFEGGLTVDIGLPDFELRTAIVLIKAKQRGVELPIDIAKIIAANAENPRKLEGDLIKVITQTKLQNLPLDKEIVINILGQKAKEVKKKSLNKEEVIQTVASYFNLKLSQIKGNKRDRVVSLPRQILYYILYSELKAPLEEIGEFLGGRDHTTILHGVRKISSLLATDENIKKDVLGIKERLFG